PVPSRCLRVGHRPGAPTPTRRAPPGRFASTWPATGRPSPRRRAGRTALSRRILVRRCIDAPVDENAAWSIARSGSLRNRARSVGNFSTLWRLGSQTRTPLLWQPDEGRPIPAAAIGGAAMEDLVAEDVEPAEQCDQIGPILCRFETRRVSQRRQL